MTDWITVKTKAEFEAALKKDKDAFLEITGGGFTASLKVGSPALKILAAAAITLICEGASAPSIVTWGTSAPSIVTRENSAPRIETWESSAPSIEAWETSAPSIVTRGTSAPRIVTWGTSAPSIVTRENSAPRIVTRESSAPSIETRGTSAPRIVTRGTSAPRIETWESSAPRIEAWESSAPRIETWESSAPSIEARENSAPRIVTRESSAPSIEAWESSAPSIVTRGTSAPRIETWENSAPRIVTRESSAPSIETWGTSAPSIEAAGYSHLRIRGAAKVSASVHVTVVLHGIGAEVIGGSVQTIDISTPDTWCDYYGVHVEAGVAILFKSVDNDYSTERARRVGISYRPGEIPVAPDWDGGVEECGGGLHASPHPRMARAEFNQSGAHAVACPVRLEDIAVHPGGNYPQKVKFRGCCAPVYEVDWDGQPLPVKAEAAAL
jgi:hypothetical protein